MKVKEKTTVIAVTFDNNVFKMLEELCSKNNVKRSVMVNLAIQNEYNETIKNKQ